MGCLVDFMLPSGYCITFPVSNCAENELGAGIVFFIGTVLPLSSMTSCDFDLLPEALNAARNTAGCETGIEATEKFGLIIAVVRIFLALPGTGVADMGRVELFTFRECSFVERGTSSNLMQR
jgi:hypothetical protein